MFGEWDSAEQHAEFTKSSCRDEVVRPQEGVLEFVDVVHVTMGEGEGEGGIGGLLNGKGKFWLKGAGYLKGEEEEQEEVVGARENVVVMRRCDVGFEKESYVFVFGGDDDDDNDTRYKLAGSVELVNLE